MSKSIKQYKIAMDNVKISDSFARRTETLLKEEAERENRIAIASSSGERFRKKYVAAGVLTAFAACMAAVFILKPLTATEGTAELTAEDGAAVTAAVTSESGDEEVYYESENDDFAAAVNGAELLDGGFEEDEAVAAGEGINQSAEEEKDYEADSADSAPEVQAAVAPSAAAAQEASADTSAQTEKAASGATAAKPSAEATVPEDDIIEVPVSDEQDNEVPEIKLLYDIDFENSDLEIIFYDATYGNGNEEKNAQAEDNAAVKQNIITTLGGIIYNKGKTTSSPITYKIEFIIRITDKSTGEESFTIYVTYNNAVIVTAHTPTGQIRNTYLLSAADHSEIEHMLYLYFGTESDYEAFCALKSGK